jgi:hypothetical protein
MLVGDLTTMVCSKLDDVIDRMHMPLQFMHDDGIDCTSMGTVNFRLLAWFPEADHGE